LTTKIQKYALDQKTWERLQPFFHRKESRQRVILYLLAAGYSITDLIEMTIKELKEIPMQNEISVSRDEAIDSFPDDNPAFTFASGKIIGRPFYRRLLRYAGTSATGGSVSQESFRAYLNEK